jgi:hypothetical protein
MGFERSQTHLWEIYPQIAEASANSFNGIKISHGT